MIIYFLNQEKWPNQFIIKWEVKDVRSTYVLVIVGSGYLLDGASTISIKILYCKETINLRGVCPSGFK